MDLLKVIIDNFVGYLYGLIKIYYCKLIKGL